MGDAISVEIVFLRQRQFKHDNLVGVQAVQLIHDVGVQNGLSFFFLRAMNIDFGFDNRDESGRDDLPADVELLFNDGVDAGRVRPLDNGAHFCAENTRCLGFAKQLGQVRHWFHQLDAVIFVGYAGRFGTPRATCESLTRRLRRPWGSLAPALPIPGGGVQLETVPELIEFYGRDTMLLVGGSLQIEEGAVLERSRAFVRSVREASAGA